MAIYLMDKTYRTTAAGIASARAVIAGPGTGLCSLPSTANEGKILGVTVTSQPDMGRGISVRKAGIAEVVAAGSIQPGDPVNIADSSGRVKAVSEASGTKVECLGYAETGSSNAGDIIEVFISPHQRTV